MTHFFTQHRRGTGQQPPEQTEAADGNAFRERLRRRFERQRDFAAAYSPLYHRLFGLTAGWLAAWPGEDLLADWLVTACAHRAPFEVPLLLLAGLHRDILQNIPEAAGLARYYPTAGGDLPPEDEKLAAVLRETVSLRREALAAFFAAATVQTNETARGLCWLLPVLYTGWPAVHLAELGASAGLNLVADERHYQLGAAEEGRGRAAAMDNAPLLAFGRGEAGQFRAASTGSFPLPDCSVLPGILSRTGCDQSPCVPHTEEDEQTLAAFVWGDQPRRLAMLRQGIAALRRLEARGEPINLARASLPADLPAFLEMRLDFADDAPLVLFNTFLRTYLPDRGASLAPQLASWAEQYKKQVLWLQWEPLWEQTERGENRAVRPPQYGQLAWTADLWHRGEHRRWHLAWVHPHGTGVHWLDAAPEWAAFWRRYRR